MPDVAFAGTAILIALAGNAAFVTATKLLVGVAFHVML